MIAFLAANLKWIVQLIVFIFTYFKGKGDETDAKRAEQLERELRDERLARKAGEGSHAMSDDELIDSVYKDTKGS